jgi:RNA polymerase sigma factor (sigma-70 family)
MSSVGSVTKWIEQVGHRDQGAAQQLWERYARRLAGLARAKLKGVRLRAADEEDVVQSAFNSFFLGVEKGRFTKLSDRNNLWPLLVLITARKAHDLRQHERRGKRGGGAVRGESALVGAIGLDEEVRGFDQVLATEPTPASAAEMSEGLAKLLDCLDDPELRSVALWKLEGFTNDEIATKLGRSRATVERRLNDIRTAWESEAAR